MHGKKEEQKEERAIKWILYKYADKWSEGSKDAREEGEERDK
jgi:hypothetical protein